MKNNCKSCNHFIAENDLFCVNYGAKIVNDRLSLKGTWEEFVGPFFIWDNNFWRTFFGLFKNPKDVLEAYISGARKKYFQPFSYLILFTTIAIFFYKIFPIEISNQINELFANGNNITSSNGKRETFDLKSSTDFSINYFNFLMILSMPYFALISFLLFKKRNHNFSEHLVFNSYLLTNTGYLGLIFQLIIIRFLNLNFLYFFAFYYFLMFIYIIYAFKDLYSLNYKQSLFAFIKYIFLFLFLYFGIILVLEIFSLIIGFIYGYLTNKF
jgi:hypothetical protein